MKADLSRNTFDRTRHYSAVRLQQGRIVTDADWNEQADIARYRAERAARDTIGACGAPLDAAGYRLVAETNAVAVRAINANVAWVAAEDGLLLATSDGGAAWTRIDAGTAVTLRALAAAGSTGWAVGDGGVVRRTSDGGLTWIAQDAGTAAALRGVAAVDADHAWAVGDGGIVVHTADGGLSWEIVQTAAARLHAVAFTSASSGLAVGQGGAILQTVDGGTSWTPIESGSGAHLRALARVDTSHWWAAGTGGTILRSDDGGATWFAGTTPTLATLHAIAFRDEQEGWAVGDAGTLLHSADGGATWQAEASSAGDAALRGLSLVGGEAAWAVGDGGAALRVGAGSPDLDPLALPAMGLSIEPGRYYVDGMLCELDARCSYAHQPDGGAGERLAPGAWLIYIDAWQHHVSALEDAAIRETALGGIDTATRARTVAQVRALPLPAASPFAWSCDSSVADWDALLAQPRPRLSARSEPQLAATNLCEIAATAGYRRLENQLYRVEIHTGGATPTFKWSRENGSVVYAVESVTADAVAQRTTVRVVARGRDANLDLAVHDRVELLDDEAELAGRAGALFEYIADGNDGALELVLAGVPPAGLGQDPLRHAILRRWDHQPATAGANTLPVAFDTWLDLEDGVQVRFDAGGVLRPGDYWQIPARTITADVEWPRDEDGDPLAREPAGIADAFCRIGIVEVDEAGTVFVASDCRRFFPPLTEMEQLLYVSGDGQDAAPGAPLPQALQLRVARGTLPIAGAGVRFAVEAGDGLVGPGPGGSPWHFETSTDADGLAQCRWTLGPGAGAPGRFQRVRADLLDADGLAVPGQSLVYAATSSLSLEMIGGDGQQAPGNGTLAQPLSLRVSNGGVGVAGVVLGAAVTQGGGAIVGTPAVTTDAGGYAAITWRLGTGGSQQLTVRLADAQGVELQRLAYGATVAQAGAGGSCDITIGPGGQFERLDSALLARLLEQNRGQVCLCFMPGVHIISNLVLAGADQNARLSMHGCGAATQVNVVERFQLAKFASFELRDMALSIGAAPVVLQATGVLSLSHLAINRTTTAATDPLLSIEGANIVRMAACQLASASASALIEGVTGECHLTGNIFSGPLSFYGAPGDDPSSALRQRFGDGQRAQLNGSARLHMTDNTLQLLTVGTVIAKQLIEQATADGVFGSATLQGNTFMSLSNVYIGTLLSFNGNTFVAPPRDGLTPYGTMLATRAAAAGNVAVVGINDAVLLRFLIPSDGGFSGAANQVSTSPNSTR